MYIYEDFSVRFNDLISQLVNGKILSEKTVDKYLNDIVKENNEDYIIQDISELKTFITNIKNIKNIQNMLFTNKLYNFIDIILKKKFCLYINTPNEFFNFIKVINIINKVQDDNLKEKLFNYIKDNLEQKIYFNIEKIVDFESFVYTIYVICNIQSDNIKLSLLRYVDDILEQQFNFHGIDIYTFKELVYITNIINNILNDKIKTKLLKITNDSYKKIIDYNINNIEQLQQLANSIDIINKIKNSELNIIPLKIINNFFEKKITFYINNIDDIINITDVITIANKEFDNELNRKLLISIYNNIQKKIIINLGDVENFKLFIKFINSIRDKNVKNNIIQLNKKNIINSFKTLINCYKNSLSKSIIKFILKNIQDKNTISLINDYFNTDVSDEKFLVTEKIVEEYCNDKKINPDKYLKDLYSNSLSQNKQNIKIDDSAYLVSSNKIIAINNFINIKIVNFVEACIDYDRKKLELGFISVKNNIKPNSTYKKYNNEKINMDLLK